MDPYDTLGYTSLSIPETHPERLAVLGRLMGLRAADPARCRVLEIGCASGGNLIPMAQGLPQSRFLGIDRSAAQVRAGQALVERLGLGNAAIRRADILHLDPNDPDLAGGFDYILAHGVYSWVPPEVADRLLTLAGALLAPGGIFYVSWNVLPGWRLRGTLSDCLRDACRDATEPALRLAAAQTAMERLERALDGLPGAAAALLREEIRRVREAPPSYLYFEYLDAHNRPRLVRDFLADCERAGLRYLCDTRLHTLFPASLGDAVEQALADLEDGVDVEQWLDFAGNRAFRQSLLIRADAECDAHIALDRFAAFAFLCDLVPPTQPHLQDETPVAFVAPDGEAFTVTHPLTKATLAVLAGAYPDAVALPQAVPEARRRVLAAGAAPTLADAADAADAALAELFGLFAHGALDARLAPRPIPRSGA